MQKLSFSILLLIPSILFSQKETAKLARAFPITSYTVDLNDSVKLVQVLLNEGPVLMEKQVGLLKGMFRDKKADTISIGIGRCQLIKGSYYYFSINHKQSGAQPREGDLLYTMVEKPAVYNGRMLNIASHFIGLQNVYDDKFFDRYAIFSKWSAQEESASLDSMVRDIRFTGKYFLDNNPSMNVKITEGRFNGKMVLNVMIDCNVSDLTDFLDYILARPRLYAGHEWKISEIFATWLSSGSPTVIR